MKKDKCACCGATEDLQIHHWLYLNEKDKQEAWVSTLCRVCHQKLHPNHGVGRSKNVPLFNKFKEKYLELSDCQNKTRREIADEIGISYMTACLWDKELEIKRTHRRARRKGLNSINVYFENSEMEVLKKVKGDKTWHDVIYEYMTEAVANEINPFALRMLCMEYDLEYKAYPESEYEGYSILCFLLKRRKLPFLDADVKEWRKRLIEMKRLMKEEKE